MERSYPKLYLAPMSKEIADVILRLHSPERPIGFIISRRQIDFNSGYVNGWRTDSFSHYIRSRSGPILCRDHGGPMQGERPDSGIISLQVDTHYADIIHLDPWKTAQSCDAGVSATIHLLKNCYALNPKCQYEIGTEEAIRAFDEQEMKAFVQGVRAGVTPEIWERVRYLVIQSGTRLLGNRNIGHYNASRMSTMIDIARSNGLLSKEHNGDYLDGSLMADKFRLGLDAVNIAPELGVLQTSCLLEVTRGTPDFESIFDLCYRKASWRKWLPESFDPESNKAELVSCSCHYLYSDPEMKDIIDHYPQLHELIEEVLVRRVTELLLIVYA